MCSRNDDISDGCIYHRDGGICNMSFVSFNGWWSLLKSSCDSAELLKYTVVGFKDFLSILWQNSLTWKPSIPSLKNCDVYK